MKVQEGRKYAGGETQGEHVQQDFGRENARQNRKYEEMKEVQEKKEVWNVEQDTSTTTIAGGEIRRRVKAHKG